MTMPDCEMERLVQEKELVEEQSYNHIKLLLKAIAHGIIKAPIKKGRWILKDKFFCPECGNEMPLEYKFVHAWSTFHQSYKCSLNCKCGYEGAVISE